MPPRRKPLKICFVAHQLYSWEESTDFNDAAYAIAQTAASLGDQVTFLWAPLIDDRRKVDPAKEDWIRSTLYEKYLVRLEILEASPQLLPGLYTIEKVSHSVYHYLKTNDFDAAYIALEGGVGYYTLLARELGLFDRGPRIFTLAHSPLEWRKQADRTFVDSLGELAVVHMERYCVEAAESLICTSDYLKGWMAERGWNIPADCQVLPPVRPFEWHLNSGRGTDIRRNINEIVYISGYRYRHGIGLLVSALDRLCDEFPDLTVTTIGKFGHLQGEHSGGMMLRTGRRWPFALKFLPELNERETVVYLRQRNCLVVIPSIAASVPQALLTCLDEGIPFVATNVGGIAEMISDGETRDCLRAPKPAELAGLMADKLRNGASPVRPATKSQDKQGVWTQHFAGVAAARPIKTIRKLESQPLVSVIMAHYNRPHYLPQAVASVERQDYPNVELIIVDDGSTQPEAIEVLAQIEDRIRRRGWKVVRTPNRYLGAARNEGIRASCGDYILFVDDDNALFDSAISTFIGAMNRSGADICTTFSKVLHAANIPANEAAGFIQYLPLGGSLPLGLVHNSFGDANAMIRRDVVDRIGYQIEDYGCTVQDWEYFARAVFAGLKLRIIPEPLYWYRSDPEGMYRSSNWYDNRLPILNVYRSHKFAEVDLVMQAFVAQNVDKSDSDSAAHNLQFSISNSKHQALAKLAPNSAEARSLLAEIAVLEGRPDTGLLLLALEQRADFGKKAIGMLGVSPPSTRAAIELGGGLPKKIPLSFQDIRTFVIASEADGPPPLFYVEEPDSLFLGAEGGEPSVVVQTGVCEPGSIGVSATVQLGDELSGPAEFLILMTPVNGGRNLLAALGSGQWTGVSRAGEPREIAFAMPVPVEEPMNFILAVRNRSRAPQGRVLGKFSEISVHRALGLRAARPRRGAPQQSQRARIITESELKTARIVTKREFVRSPILVAPKDGGLFLRPDLRGPVVASLDWVFPPFAKKVIGKVEIAHDDAPAYEFAMALVRPDEDPDWKRGEPVGALAFSGWQKFVENYVLHDIEVGLDERIRTHLSLQLAIRVPKGSKASPTNTFFRKLAVVWDD